MISNKMKYLLAFTIPVLILLVVMIYLGIVPFGDHSVFMWDARLQHKDYYGYLWDVLHGNASIEFSTGKSLGGRMIGVIGFYISSPLNILLLFFKKSQVPLFMSIMIIIRVGLCGLTSQYFLTKRFQLSAVPALLFSTSYALMEYNIYYCRNVMWLDGVIILPLVAVGVWKLISEDKKVLLWLTVVLAIVSNWYTGYMVCLMSGIYFLYEYCLYHNFQIIKTLRTGIKKIATYIITMLLGVMGSCIVLLPACLSLIGGKATYNSERFTGIIHFDLLHFFSGYEIGAEVNNQMAPVIFCGGIILISCFYYFLCANISKKEKILTAIFSLFFILSFCLQDLELLWTAYVKSSSYYFRFAFIVPFFMLIIASRAWINIREYGIDRKGMVYGILLLLAIFYILYRGDELNTNIRILILYILLLILIGIAIVLSENHNTLLRRVAIISLFIMSFVELSYNARKAFEDYADSNSLFITYAEDMENVVDELNDLSKDTFFRFEKNQSYLTLNDPSNKVATCEALLFNYNSIEHYSSAYDGPVDRFLAEMGYSDLITNEEVFRTETYWNSPMILTDSLLSIRYAVLPSEIYGYEQVDLKAELPFENEKVYENQYVLPLAYNVSDDLDKITFGENPFENQELLLQAMTGEEVDAYKDVPQELTSFSGDDEVWRLTAVTDGSIYLYVDSGEIHSNLYADNCEVYVNGQYLQDSCSRFSINSMFLGDYSAGDIIEVRIRHNSNDLEKHTIYTAQLDWREFESAMNILQTGYECDLQVEDNKISGEYITETDSTVFLSIPYEENWTIYVDGEEVEYDKLADVFIGINLKKGSHEIEMVYRTPGLRLGALLTVIGTLLFFGYNFFSNKSKKRPNKVMVSLDKGGK